MIKDVPIQTPDGKKVHLGMPIYTIETKEVSSYERRSWSIIKTKSGDSRAFIVKNEVISINQASNARTFTVRSDRGCEHTYSVHNSCLDKLYGKITSARKAKKEIDQEDLENITKKIKAKQEWVTKEIKEIKVWEMTHKKLSSLR